MGLIDFVLRLLGISRKPAPAESGEREVSSTANEAPFESVLTAEPAVPASPPPAPADTSTVARPSTRAENRASKLKPFAPETYQSSLVRTNPLREVSQGKPYQFAWFGDKRGQYRDLSLDCDQRWLDYFGLPVLKTPQDIADWLQVPIGKLAWMTHRTVRGQRAESEQKSHYTYHWIPKKTGGYRLIEAPKSELKEIQTRILRELLSLVPPHRAAHGFVAGHSILTNAEPHVGQRLVLKFDLENFYTNIRYSRVVAIFRSVGYSREVALWLARLTTNSIPWDLKSPLKSWELQPYSSRHLPQGAPTSPALANLSAFGLDVRLTGLAEAYELEYTRYADDLTFSGPGVVIPALPEVIPLIERIIRNERFRSRGRKRRVLRDSSRQSVTGVVVNEKLNVSRKEFDQLKAILHNCRKLGPSTQKRDLTCDLQSHLLGRISHVQQLNPERGAKLRRIYDEVNWTK